MRTAFLSAALSRPSPLLLLDSNVVINFTGNGILQPCLEALKAAGLRPAFPAALQREVLKRHHPTVLKAFQDVVNSGHLELAEPPEGGKTRVEEDAKDLGDRALDPADAWLFALADRLGCSVATDDILASFAYLEWRLGDDVRNHDVEEERLFASFFDPQKVGDLCPQVRTGMLYDWLSGLGKITPHPEHYRWYPAEGRTWFAEEIAEKVSSVPWVRQRGVRLDAMAVGALASSLTCGGRELGLCMKSTRGKSGVHLLVRKVRDGEWDRWSYNLFAKHAAMKYLLGFPPLLYALATKGYVREEGGSRIAPFPEWEACADWSEHFRRTFEAYRTRM